MTSPQSVNVIAIDGPGGAGKGTASCRVATALSWHILDSGMIYRLLGLASIRAGVSSDDEAALAALALRLDVDFRPVLGSAELLALLNGEDVSSEIRSEEAGMTASKVAVFPAVRDALLDRQRAFARPPGLVADGRDMGTVVFEDAALKVFLTASVESRAKRRLEQLRSKGLSGNLARLSEAIAARDDADMNRSVSPLKPADDAICIDSTGMGIAEVSDQILSLAKQRGLV